MNDRYYDKVKIFLYKIPQGSCIEVLKVCKKENTAKFIETARIVLEQNWSVWGWQFSFSNDYTRIKRIDVDSTISFTEYFKCKS